MKWRTVKYALAFLLLLVPGLLAAQNIFRFSAPPGGIYANVSYEQTALVTVEVTVEHRGDAVPDWFIGGTAGGGSYTNRQVSRTLPDATINYQLYPTTPNGSTDVLASPDFGGFGANNVITSNAFDTATAVDVSRFETFFVYYEVPADQFSASGEYTDTVTLELYTYTGVLGSSATYDRVDTATLTVTARMARLIDLYAVQEPGIRTMDLTVPVTDRLLATVHERSNADTGYEVSITSSNLAAAGSGTTPFFAQASGPGVLDYSLTYGGDSIGDWESGTALVTNSELITDTTGDPGANWLTRDLRISYSGSPNLPAGDYEDRLIITITAK
ncbi:MAG: hypothetical protein EA383_13310 [Spirochaetaceae bacterium]|nr:MAG: hypothetical protein EA383_13310 [Spirochaetaceae bacterium]